MQPKTLVLIVALASLFSVAAPKTFASNLLVNGSFETGNFTGWSLTTCGPPDCEVYSGPYNAYYSGAENGIYYAILGPVGINTLSQAFSDTAGVQYTFSFWFAAIGDTQSYFSASWDGTQLLGVTAPNTGGVWTQYSYTAVGTGADSVSFSFVDINRVMALDNASVLASSAPTPEPDSFILLGTAALALGGGIRRKLR